MATKDITINPRQILPVDDLKFLNERSDLKGCLQLLGHLAVLGLSGYLWATQRGRWAIALPALVVYGFSLASLFAAMHECVHRTAFASPWLNNVVGWWAGVLSFYNYTFYWYYHKWHHVFTQIPGKDPELEEPKPTSFSRYLLQISGLPWWWGKVQGYWQLATGKMADMPYVPETAYGEVRRATWFQLGVYGLAIAISLVAQQTWFLLYWVLPLAVGQPLLRLILIAEHTGCDDTENPLANTRTTLTLWPIKLLMWNMPFHAEHHLYPSIPFHRLPAAHTLVVAKLTHVSPGYVQVNRSILANLAQPTA